MSSVFKKVPTGVTLVAAIKYAPDAESVNRLIRAGVQAVGENRVQDAENRLPALLPCEKHFIGTIQSNKIGKIAKLFEVVQSLDDVGHAQKLDAAASREGKTLRVLAQINAGDEKQKHGLACEKAEVAAFLAALKSLNHLKVEGLMVVVPLESNSRPFFRKAKLVFDALKAEFGLSVLSMGTSDDFEVAIQEGANMVRVGRALFELDDTCERTGTMRLSEKSLKKDLDSQSDERWNSI